jgi:hypothetical protein
VQRRAGRNDGDEDDGDNAKGFLVKLQKLADQAQELATTHPHKDSGDGVRGEPATGRSSSRKHPREQARRLVSPYLAQWPLVRRGSACCGRRVEPVYFAVRKWIPWPYVIIQSL